MHDSDLHSIPSLLALRCSLNIQHWYSLLYHKHFYEGWLWGWWGATKWQAKTGNDLENWSSLCWLFYKSVYSSSYSTVVVTHSVNNPVSNICAYMFSIATQLIINMCWMNCAFLIRSYLWLGLTKVDFLAHTQQQDTLFTITQ